MEVGRAVYPPTLWACQPIFLRSSMLCLGVEQGLMWNKQARHTFHNCKVCQDLCWLQVLSVSETPLQDSFVLLYDNNNNKLLVQNIRKILCSAQLEEKARSNTPFTNNTVETDDVSRV